MIIRLDEKTINKIAAGEVIERPSSVVKELIENSIDAGAKQISIELVDSGLKMIKISDDGQGMSKEDAFLCFERHTTSKLRDENDLSNISTLGFRGEALASIAAVSNLIIMSKDAASREGTYIEVEAGKLMDRRDFAMNTGTIVQVNDLFFNAPVRKKYLETLGNELKKIIDVVQAFSLGYENISFKLSNNNKTILDLPKSDTIGRIISLFGVDLAKNIFKIEYFDRDIEIQGYVSKPGYTKADRSYQYIFINNRLVQCKEAITALYDAYHSLLFTQRHPVAILKINTDPNKIDVNVHPQKTEIRVDKSLKLYESVFDSISEGFKSEGLYLEPTAEINQKLIKNEERKKEPRQSFSVQKFMQTELKESDKKDDFYIFGQLHKCFILVENKDGLAIYDQHVVHERINYEMLMKKYETGGISTQALISPLTIELAPNKAIMLNQRIHELSCFGIEIEEFGQNTFLIRSLPVVMGRQMDKDIIFDIIDELSINEVTVLDEIKEAILIRMSCRAAVKKGDVLSHSFMAELIRKLGECELPYTCPHGRPAVIRFSINDLEKLFKRI